MDETDRAQERDLQYQADCELERRYQAAKASLPATGECLDAVSRWQRDCGFVMPNAVMDSSMNRD